MPRHVVHRDALHGEKHRVCDDGFVLCKLVWVLDSGYGYQRADIARLLRGMASAPALTLERHDRVCRAMALYEKGRAGFSDCLIACACEDESALPVFTFDRGALKTANLFKEVP
jgi:predicted nucleic-acid-binding protein